MTLLIETPTSYEPERRYILDVLFTEWLGIGYELHLQERSDVRVSLKGDSSSAQVVLPDGLFATDRRGWLTPASLPQSPLRWEPVTIDGPGALRGGERLPVMYGPSRPPQPLLSGEGARLQICVDVLGSAFFMLTRFEEVVLGLRDQYGRFPAVASVACNERFLQLPIVDAYVELLWRALGRLWPRLPRRRRRFQLSLTHDVDRPLSFLGHKATSLLRQLAADALVRRDLALLVQRLRSWAGIPKKDYRLDPYNTFDFLMRVSERQGLSSAFYFLATKNPSARDGFYTLAHPWIRSLISLIHRRGHEIGFHAGFDTYRDRERTASEYRRLRSVTRELQVSQDHWGGRQHYLRWESPGTWSNWEYAGLDYDSTPGFAEQLGFRFGTCHEFRTFDLVERRPLQLQERPLIVMDGTLFEYMKLNPGEASSAVLALARECRRYEGTLMLLWHNSSLPTAARQRWYEALIQTVSRPC